MCWEARSSPQGHLSGRLFGYGSVGMVAVCSWNKAFRDAGLYVRRSFGNVVEGVIRYCGSGGCLCIQTVVCCWRALACNQHLDVRELLHFTVACAPCFSKASTSSLPRMPQCAGVHRPATLQPLLSSLWMANRAFRANSEFVGLPIASVVRAD